MPRPAGVEGAVRFRAQHLTSDRQRRFASHWGELETSLLAAGSSEDVVRFDKAPTGPR